MKMFLVGFAVLGAFALVSGIPECSVNLPDTKGISNKWVTMETPCITGMKNQIQTEIEASYAYLEMASYFSRDTVNRPGFAEMFFHAAKEERDHGIKLIEYLSMRGELTESLGDLISFPYQDPKQQRTVKWTGVTALEHALEMETSVTNSIRRLIDTCDKKPEGEDKSNDYHLVDYLTGVYLEEQYKGQRDIAGKLTTLKKMAKQGPLAEFLFDKELL